MCLSWRQVCGKEARRDRSLLHVDTHGAATAHDGFQLLRHHTEESAGVVQGRRVRSEETTQERGAGIFKMASAKSDPGMIVLGWMDNRPVYFLASQGSTEMTTIQRREKNGEITTVECPRLVLEYQKNMGGVDLHDQLRMASYPLQLSNRYG